MPRFNVHHNGKWDCFSSISDGFVTPFMDKAAYEEWRKVQYGIHNYEPAERCNMKEIDEAVHSIALNRDHDEALIVLLEVFTQEEAEKLLYDCETEYYCPVPDDNGGFSCPNCGTAVTKGQAECACDSCGNRLVWRRMPDGIKSDR